jgi:cell division protein FtsL
VYPRRTLWDRVSLFGCIAICTAAGWILLSVSASVATINHRIDTLNTQIQAVSAANASYTAQVAALTQPSRILQEAKQLGMKYANPVVIGQTSSSANQ